MPNFLRSARLAAAGRQKRRTAIHVLDLPSFSFEDRLRGRTRKNGRVRRPEPRTEIIFIGRAAAERQEEPPFDLEP